MRKITLLIIAIIIINKPLFSQINLQDIPMAQLIENKDYSFYVGTWKWEDTTSQSEFIVKLVQAQRISSLDNTKRTYLKGVYLYKKNGEVVADYMSELDEEKEFVHYPIYVHNDRENNMKLGIRDYLLKDGYNNAKHHGGSSYIKYISSNPEQIKWKIVDDRLSGAFFTDDRMTDPPGISLPEDIILIKVE